MKYLGVACCSCTRDYHALRGFLWDGTVSGVKRDAWAYTLVKDSFSGKWSKWFARQIVLLRLCINIPMVTMVTMV